jgi:voltage-gated potassium channel
MAKHGWKPLGLGYRGLLKITNSPRALILLYLALLLVSAVCYAVFEGKSVAEAMWWAIVTASTVGYGDTYPQSVGGRVMAIVLITTMILVIIPLVTAHFASKLIVDNDAFTNSEQEEIKHQLRVIRAYLEEMRGARPHHLDGMGSHANGMSNTGDIYGQYADQLGIPRQLRAEPYEAEHSASPDAWSEIP